MSHVVLCGIGFSGTHEPEDGLIYTVLTDWDGVPAGRSRGDAIPSAHGSYDRTDVWRDSRAISMRGAIITGSDEEFHRVKRRLEGIDSIGEMRVDQGDGYWARDVEIDRVTIPDRRWRTSVEFTVDMVAPDPVRYTDWLRAGPAGLPEKTGGLVLPSAFPWHFGTATRPVATVDNWGELPVLPRVTVEGSASALTVHGGPTRMEFGAFNGVLVLDSSERRAFLDGVDVTREVVRRDWPSVMPGTSSDFYMDPVGVSPGTELSVDYRIGVW